MSWHQYQWKVKWDPKISWDNLDGYIDKIVSANILCMNLTCEIHKNAITESRNVSIVSYQFHVDPKLDIVQMTVRVIEWIWGWRTSKEQKTQDIQV